MESEASCRECGATFADANQLDVHRAAAHQVVAPTYRCRECSAIRSSQEDLDGHLRDAHGISRKSRAKARDVLLEAWPLALILLFLIVLAVGIVNQVRSDSNDGGSNTFQDQVDQIKRDVCADEANRAFITDFDEEC